MPQGEAKVKAPGTINGQAFTVDNCHDCDLYILDHCGQVTVDDCNNCRLYIGPTDGRCVYVILLRGGTYLQTSCTRWLCTVASAGVHGPNLWQ